MLDTLSVGDAAGLVSREAWLLDLGRAEYGRTWELQKALAERRAADLIPDGLILVEHDPVVTLGRRGTDEDILDPSLPVFRVERGGEATFHGPGQLVGYPILRLPDRLEVKRLVNDLEDVIILACADFDIDAVHEGPERGVWVKGKKIASMGLAVRKGVTFHGFAHNVSTDLSYFLKIRPCGHAGTIMTSMERILGHPVDLEDVKASVIVAFQRVFGLSLRRVNLAELLPEGAPPAPAP
jgi:lipoyl(octanoyl) transferase